MDALHLRGTQESVHRKDKDEHYLMTIKQRETESIASFQEWFQTKFNLILGANPKIAVIAFVEGLRLSKFKESLLMRRPQDLEEVNEWSYKYIRIEDAEKKTEKGCGKLPVEDKRREAPSPRGEVPWTGSGYSTGPTPEPTCQGVAPSRASRGIRGSGRREELKDYVHKETQNVNRPFDRDRLRSPDGPPNITRRVIVISRGRSGGEDSGSARRAYANRDIYVVTVWARPEFPYLSFSGKDFEGIECPHEDPLVITPVIANFEVGQMLVDTGSSIDILFLDAYLKLWMSRAQI
ncbi:hypothetical protein LIER_10402 [Lithospermum erythrorhizon]|uniref:Retrotransposon gag domain-containing protein n=1 Tax=Lithospermum erythrorhizon TaxID=34254 RepID=A0AAV3PKE4_LITER